MRNILSSNPKAYSKWLQNCGIDEDTADQMAGHYPSHKQRQQRNQRWATIGVSILLVFTVTFLTAAAFWTSITQAHGAEMAESKSSEYWFAACLSGATVQVGDQLFQCLTAGRAPK